MDFNSYKFLSAKLLSCWCRNESKGMNCSIYKKTIKYIDIGITTKTYKRSRHPERSDRWEKPRTRKKLIYYILGIHTYTIYNYVCLITKRHYWRTQTILFFNRQNTEDQKPRRGISETRNIPKWKLESTV